MRYIKYTLGIIWATLALILILALFPGLRTMSEGLSKAPFMKIHPRYTGGEITDSVKKSDHTLYIHRPVFNGLVKERMLGFVQIDWHGNIPDKISDTIDYNFDTIPDFIINIDTRNNITDLKKISAYVYDCSVSTPTSFGWVIRVNVANIK